MPLLTLMMLVVLSGVLPALAERRVALVIGNQQYENIPSLEKSAADARAYAALFRDKGFDRVILKENLTRTGMDLAIAQFIETVEPGDAAVFVYAGHGWSDGSQNYLVPTDAPRTGSEDFLKRISLPIKNGADGVLDAIEHKGARLKVAIVDACRDNPFVLAGGTRSIGMSRGFNRMAPPPAGTFVVFSAGAGQTALDRLSDSDPNPNGVFTRTFLPLLRADRTLLDATKEAQEKVYDTAKTIGHDQQPAYYDETRGNRACLSNACAETPGTTIAIDYQLAERIGTIAAWDAFLARHGGNGGDFYTRLAEAARNKLDPRPPPLPTPVTEPAAAAQAPADAAVLAALPSAGSLPAPPGPSASSAPPVGIEPAAAPSPEAAPTSEPALKVIDLPRLKRDLQSELKRVGCYPGTIDGIWGPQSQSGIAEFGRQVSLDVPDISPSDNPQGFASILDRLRAHAGPACVRSCNARQQMIDGRCVARTCESGQSLGADGSCTNAKQSQNRPLGVPPAGSSVGGLVVGGASGGRGPAKTQGQDCFIFNNQQVCE